MKKVFVGLSGGVDSAVSAALLKKDGYDVTGVFIKVWQPEWVECNWKEDRRDAMRVAAHLGIPFVTLDLEHEYKKEVIDNMISEYAAGRTPNPDVLCNREVKFGAFWRWAKEQGADFVATGHYTQNNKKGAWSMEKGIDDTKDQSYFLWTLNQMDLEHVLFPVGHMKKSQVREMAERFGLPNAEKKDSQGLCFIGKVDIKDFLGHYIESKPGKVLDYNGEVIGIHPGAVLFTKGERHGFTINSDMKTPLDVPHYVVEKDMKNNTITVSNRERSELLPGATREVKIVRANWVSGEAPDNEEEEKGDGVIRYPFQARSRYRQTLQNCRIIYASNIEAKIEFEEPQDTLTPGQSLVIYDGYVCLGGGIII